MFRISSMLLTVLFSPLPSFGMWGPFRSMRFNPLELKCKQQILPDVTVSKKQLIQRIEDIHPIMLSKFRAGWLRVYYFEKKRMDLALNQTPLPQDRREWIYPEEAYQTMEVLSHHESHIICFDDKWRPVVSLYAWNFPYHLFVSKLEDFQKGCVLGSRRADQYTPIINLGISLCDQRFGGPTAVKLGYLPDQSMQACKGYHELLRDLRVLEDSEKEAMESRMQQEEKL